LEEAVVLMPLPMPTVRKWIGDALPIASEIVELFRSVCVRLFEDQLFYGQFQNVGSAGAPAAHGPHCGWLIGFTGVVLRQVVFRRDQILREIRN
jgi:hypothetical protein